MSKEVTLVVPQGIGDIFWIYQQLAPHVDGIHWRVAVTEPGDHVQARSARNAGGETFLELLPKTLSVGLEHVDQGRYGRVASCKLPVKAVIDSPEPIDYSCNYHLENGVHLTDTNPGFAIEETVPIRCREVHLPSRSYVLLYVCGDTMKDWVRNIHCIWTMEEWIRFVKAFYGRYGFDKKKFPIFIIGANYDRVVIEPLFRALVADGFQCFLFIDHPPSVVTYIIKNALCLLAYQSGIGVIGDNLDTPTLNMTYGDYPRMNYSWAKKRNIESGRFRADSFGVVSPEQVAIDLNWTNKLLLERTMPEKAIRLPDIARYFDNPVLMMREHQEWERQAWVANVAQMVHSLVREHGLNSIADVGCRSGVLAKHFSNVDYIGIDDNRSFIQIAKAQHGGDPKKAFHLHDIRAPLVIPASDLVVSFGFLKHVGLHEWDSIFERILGLGTYAFVGMQTSAENVDVDDGTEFHHVTVSRDRVERCLARCGKRFEKEIVQSEAMLPCGVTMRNSLLVLVPNTPAASGIIDLVEPGWVGVELGVDVGVSSRLFIQHGCFMWLVDPYQQDVRCDERRLMSNLADLGDRFRFVKSTSHGAISLIPNDVDFVFVDGDHTLPVVTKDLELYWLKIRSGGWLFGHDYAFPDVRQAVESFCQTRSVLAVERPNDCWAIRKP